MLLLATARVAAADRTHVSSAGDVCSPTADPCVISEVMTIDPPGELDFGLRDVVVAAGGRLRVEQATIRCGSFKVEGPELRTGIVFLDTDIYGSLHVVASGRCSQSPATGCFEDLSCAYGMGTCAGKGTIEIGAEIEATRHQGPDIELAAAGDIVLGSDIIMRATGPEGDGGGLTVVSHSGDVHIAGPVAIRQADPQGGWYGSDAGYPGELYVMAFRDIDVSAAIDMSGADEGGSVAFLAGRDVTVRNNITHDALPGRTPGTGGLSNMSAGRHVIVEPHGPNDDVTLIRSNGGSHLYQEYYSYFEGGHGGITGVDADSFIVRNKSGFQSDSPRDDCADGDPYGGNFYIYSNNFLIDGLLTARGTGRCGTGGKMFFYTYADGAIGPHGSIDASATNGGNLYFNVRGNLDLLGTVDTRGDTFTYWSDGYASFEGAGGIVQLGGDDLTVGGHVLLGGAASGTDFSARTCRLRLTPTSLIDARCLQPGNCGPAWTAPWFSAGQSMIADPGSRVLADADSPMSIAYGNAHQPPALDGTFLPPPVLDYDPWALDDCPPCGNGEIEEGETCDDWNITDGDGCNSECVNEYCIAQTEDYLSTGLCDDASACTNDRCDPLANACVHTPACVDAFECTDQHCAGNVCVVTAVDELCDDRNPCTTDICNAQVGCVHADLIGISCDDHDICTQASHCEETDGCAAPDPRPALGGRMTIGTRPGSEMLVATLDVPAAEVPEPITETGVTVHLVDDVGNVLIDTRLPGALFIAQDAAAFDYRFDDAAMTVEMAEGITALYVRKRSPQRVTVQLRVRRADFGDARIAAALGAFNLSVAFGAQPATDGCATLTLHSCRVGRKIVCRG